MTVQELIQEINKERTKENSYDTRSQKDELLLMKTMLNDTSYEVTIYGSNGPKGTFNPSQCIRDTISNIMATASGITNKEAHSLIDEYEFKTGDARNLINFSKEFINTYLETGRKISLGGRQKSDVSLVKKVFPEKEIKFPVQNEDGSYDYNTTIRKEYHGVKTCNKYPSWVKKNKE